MSRRRRRDADPVMVLEEILDAPVSIPAQVAPLVVELPAVSLDVFATVGGPKWDQLAGFVRWAQIQKMGPRSIPAWREALAAFHNRPVG